MKLNAEVTKMGGKTCSNGILKDKLIYNKKVNDCKPHVSLEI